MTGDPKEIHAREQADAGARHLAALFRRYFNALRAEGFTEEQALTLTVAYQNVVVRASRGRDG